MGGPPPFKEATSTPGAGVGGLGVPPFEEATSTPGAEVGGLGVPPIRRGDIHPWRESGIGYGWIEAGYAGACSQHFYLICIDKNASEMKTFGLIPHSFNS